MRVLIINDEPLLRKTTRMAVETAGHTVVEAPNSGKAVKAVDEEDFDAVFLDLRLGGEDGLEVLARLLKVRPDLAVVLLTAYANSSTAVEAMHRGAFDFISKPFTADQIRGVLAKLEKNKALERKVRSLEADIAASAPSLNLESAEPSVQRALQVAFKAAPTPATVLILGPLGAGKSVLAREIHRRSAQHDSAFVTVSCLSLSRELHDGDIFGHARGPNVSAANESAGKVAAAEGGTLFLDEIGEMPLEVQPKVLRLLQDREYQRVGESRVRRANVRIVAATNRSLAAEVHAGRFREDLFYRLNVINLALPALSERPADILHLAMGCLKHFTLRIGKKIEGFSAEVSAAFESYSWPGNLHELRNVIERAVILATGRTIEVGDLPDGFGRKGELAPTVGSRVALHLLEAEHIRRILGITRSLDEAARVLAIDPATLYRKRQKMGL